ncbi:uncharacterized protein LOC117322340 isoform X3 [Pecten maximus]|uniref:uncharacterized protein LOC117322340 isoform X3 n=1 Tax=Pecten maximus TaxID=6579 RepID=UPI001458BAAA|nr:uncharacterized protein LOC117322340 isoform X3 [Pecten maximus]
MAKIEPSAVCMLILTYSCYGIYATILIPTPGSWTWNESHVKCRENNSRLAYMDEINAPIKISDADIMENDVILWINNKTDIVNPCGCVEADAVENNGSVKHVGSVDECAIHCRDFPQFAVKGSNCSCEVSITCHHNQSTCLDSDNYQIYQREETCLLMFGNSTRFDFRAKFVSCEMKAGSMCRTDIIKAMYGTKFTWYEARSLCQNASSNLVDLSLVSDLERTRSIKLVKSRYYWTNGVIKHNKAGVFQITDCVQASGILDNVRIHRQQEWNSVYSCQQRCKSEKIALMDDQCGCLMESDELTSWRTSGCTTPCLGNTRDRCGGNDRFSVYRRIERVREKASDFCLAVTKNSDNNITTNWQRCGDRLDGCICRNGTVDINFVIKTINLTWEEAQEECESDDMILAVFKRRFISEWSEIQEGANFWTGTYSPTMLEFSSEAEVHSDDKCLAVTNFTKDEYNVAVLDCNQNHGVICLNDNGTLIDITTLPYEGSEHMTSHKNSPDVTSVRTTPSSTITVTTELPYTGLSPMIIGLICTVVFVAVVLTIILGVLAVLLYRFREQKRQLNMLKGPTISYSNLEHSIVVSYNEAQENEDPGGDLGNLDNVTERLDALFVRKDEMSPDEKSEHLYDVSDNVNIELPGKQQNGTVLNARGETPEPEEGEYMEVDICEESGTPIVVTNGESEIPKDVENMESSFKNNEQRKDSLVKVSEIRHENDKSDDKEHDIDDEYDHTDSYVRRCKRESDTDTYDEFNTKSCELRGSRSECLYDRVGSDSYDELKTGVAAKQKIHYEDIELNFDLP